jgi:Ca-activated chloride channel family protein
VGGSLIPIQGDNGGVAFVKDPKGEVVKSKLDENRLREIAQAADGFYLHLENGPQTMKRLVSEGLAKMQVAEINARLSRHPIERYEWPLAIAIFFFALALLINDRKTSRVSSKSPRLSSPRGRALSSTTAMFFLATATGLHAAAPGIELYNQQKFPEAYAQFQKTLQDNPGARESDRIQFDSGAAAYKMKDYSKALEAFSQALLSKNPHLQSESHYNLGNTLYQRGDAEKSDDKKLTNWESALQHYQETLKAEPQNKNAKDNYDYVKNKIEELKKKQQQQKQNQQEQQQNQQQQQNQNQQQQQDQNSSGAPPSPTPPIEPSEDAKKAKAEADKAVLAREYGKALKIMTDQLRSDSTVNYYADYIHRLEDINGIKRTDTP